MRNIHYTAVLLLLSTNHAFQPQCIRTGRLLDLQMANIKLIRRAATAKGDDEPSSVEKDSDTNSVDKANSSSPDSVFVWSRTAISFFQQQSTLPQAFDSSMPSIASWMQLLQLLSEFYNDPNVDGKLTVLEAWKESQKYGNETSRTGSSAPIQATTKAENDTINRTNVGTWVNSWNEGMTNEDIRDMGDHIWRYLIGGESVYR